MRACWISDQSVPERVAIFEVDIAWGEIGVVDEGDVAELRIVVPKNSRVPEQWAVGTSSLSETDNVMLGAWGGRGRTRFLIGG